MHMLAIAGARPTCKHHNLPSWQHKGIGYFVINHHNFPFEAVNMLLKATSILLPDCINHALCNLVDHLVLAAAAGQQLACVTGAQLYHDWYPMSCILQTMHLPSIQVR